MLDEEEKYAALSDKKKRMWYSSPICPHSFSFHTLSIQFNSIYFAFQKIHYKV